MTFKSLQSDLDTLFYWAAIYQLSNFQSSEVPVHGCNTEVELSEPTTLTFGSHVISRVYRYTYLGVIICTEPFMPTHLHLPL